MSHSTWYLHIEYFNFLNCLSHFVISQYIDRCAVFDIPKNGNCVSQRCPTLVLLHQWMLRSKLLIIHKFIRSAYHKNWQVPSKVHVIQIKTCVCVCAKENETAGKLYFAQNIMKMWAIFCYQLACSYLVSFSILMVNSRVTT